MVKIMQTSIQAYIDFVTFSGQTFIFTIKVHESLVKLISKPYKPEAD